MHAVRVFKAVGAFLLLGVTTQVHGGESRIQLLDPSDLHRAVLRAEDSGENDLAERERALAEAIDRIAGRVGRGRPTVRRARRLHRVLHRGYFDEYLADADTIEGLFGEGSYNCLSATLLYGLVARELGYDPRVLKLPGHLLMRLTIRGRDYDVETTQRYGFDVQRYADLALAELEETSTGVRRLEWSRVSPRYRQVPLPHWEVSLEAVVGFAWINRGWRLIEQGDAVAAAGAVAEAERYLSRAVTEEESARRLLVEAFRMEYEVGRFDEAYAVARIDIGLFPEQTTSRDRLLAAALKRIEFAAAADRPETAEAILDETLRACPSAPGAERLERRTAPLIAASAVRSGQWNLARRAARRYADAEPDELEGTRLVNWVERRALGAYLFGGPFEEVPSLVFLGPFEMSPAQPPRTAPE